ncbi:hypothetical protein LC087_10815 [Bacillus carboniphilus]|uniref:Bacterial surface antigen (D15) domain-containing protein n=1 Tax=Bacillus carboniphilus TaxID=86663 RepID=A0ABY9JRF6_9BACI|nr:hypothetical protein [Bacillus carboniphilus]WLR41399.1 hypothetical protein LC087_10815 [Bacillus carboniphilus]
MNNIPDYLRQQVMFFEGKIDIPYSYKSTFKSIISGDNIGAKGEAVVSKSSFSDDHSPLSLDYIRGQTEGKVNYENYTLSAGAAVIATKIEFKIEPLNFFGFEPLEEWFDIDYDPFVGLDLSLGSIGLGASVGAENSIYAAYGIGIGVKFGAEKDE